MRNLIVMALVLLTAVLGMPAGLIAQVTAPSEPGLISGEAVDAGGRPVVNQRVELVQGAEVVQTTLTGSRGEWIFTSVAPGDYVVRLTVNGQVAGIRATVAPGEAFTSGLIVAPSAAAPSAAFLAGLGPVFGTLVVAGIGAAVVATVVAVTDS